MRRLLVALAALGWLGLPTPARAQYYSVHAVGSLVTGFTDNVRNDSEEENPEAALYNQVSPSVLFTFESPRTIHISTLAIGIVEYYGTDDPPTTFTGTLSHNSLFTTSQSTEVGLGASAGTGRVSAVLGEVGGGDAGVQTQAAGATEFISVGVNQTFRWNISRDWRFNQAAGYNQVNTELEDATNPDMPGNLTTSRSTSGSLGIDRAWARTSVGLTASTSYITVLQQPGANLGCEDNDNPCTDTTQLLNSVAVNLARDFSQRWSGRLQLGVSSLYTIEAAAQNAEQSGEGFATTPSGTLAVTYFRPIGTVTVNAGISLGHSIAPNLLLGTTTQSTGGTFNVSVPLPWFRRAGEPTVRVTSVAGLIYSQAVDSTATVEPTWYVITGDIAGTWSPRDALDVSLRYQYVNQRISEMGVDALNPDPPVFARNTILLQVGGRFPTRQAVTMPDRRNLRVDRANEIPTGDEEQSIGGGEDTNPNRL